LTSTIFSALNKKKLVKFRPHALENDQVLLAHPQPGTGAPLTKKG